MNSNEQPKPYGHWAQPPSRPTPRPYSQSPEWSPGPPKPHVIENALKSGQVQIERKNFIFALKENPRGRLLRVTEDIAGRYNSIIIPATGLREFMKLLDEMIKAMEELPPEKKPLDNADLALTKIKMESQPCPKPSTKPEGNRDRAFLLQELASTDPVLSITPTSKVVEAYEQILRFTPEISEEKELVRALLRKSCAGQAVEPLEGQQLIEANVQSLSQPQIQQVKKPAKKSKAKLRQCAAKARIKASLVRPSEKNKRATTKGKLRKKVVRPKRPSKGVK